MDLAGGNTRMDLAGGNTRMDLAGGYTRTDLAGGNTHAWILQVATHARILQVATHTWILQVATHTHGRPTLNLRQRLYLTGSLPAALATGPEKGDMPTCTYSALIRKFASRLLIFFSLLSLSHRLARLA